MFSRDGEQLILECTVVPKSSEERIVGRFGDTLKIKLTASPTDGKANKALKKFLAREFHLKTADITIVKGTGSRRKTVCLKGVSKIPTAIARIES